MNTELFIYLIVCLVLGLSITLLGFARGVSDFLPNFLAGWGQFFLELIAGLFIIDRFMDRQHNKQWKKVRNIHYRILKEHLIKILNGICIKFGYVEISKNLMYKKKGFNDISPVVDSLIKELNYLDVSDDTGHKALFIEFHDEFKDDIKEVRTLFIPQIIQNIDNQKLADSLSELDLYFIKFQDDIMKCRQRDNINFNVSRLVSLVEAINEVLIKLLDDN